MMAEDFLFVSLFERSQSKATLLSAKAAKCM
jgi:hypothetical protein